MLNGAFFIHTVNTSEKAVQFIGRVVTHNGKTIVQSQTSCRLLEAWFHHIKKSLFKARSNVTSFSLGKQAPGSGF